MRAPPLTGALVELRAVEEGDVERLWDIYTSPEVARWWGTDPRNERVGKWLGRELQWTILVGGEAAGVAQAYEETGAAFRHAGIDLFLGASFHGRGLGSDTVRTVVRWLFEERRHHRVVIDPALANERAIRCYERVGFRPVGVMRRYWLDHTTGEWVDGLLLDLLAEELR